MVMTAPFSDGRRSPEVVYLGTFTKNKDLCFQSNWKFFGLGDDAKSLRRGDVVLKICPRSLAD